MVCVSLIKIKRLKVHADTRQSRWDLLNSDAACPQVTVASVEDSPQVVCSRSVRLVADTLIGDCASNTYDLIALPVSAHAVVRGYRRTSATSGFKRSRPGQRCSSLPYRAPPHHCFCP